MSMFNLVRSLVLGRHHFLQSMLEYEAEHEMHSYYNHIFLLHLDKFDKFEDF